MKNRRFIFGISIIRSVILMLVFLLVFTSFSFAEDENPGGDASERIQTEEPSEVADPMTPETPIKPAPDYNTYKGKNATRIPVITYHKVVSDKAKKSKKYKRDKWAVSQSNFNKQMAWLHKKHYRTICCEEFYMWHQGKIKLPKRTVLITVDDGHAEAINRMLPVLKKYDMKATAFVIGSSTLSKKSSSSIKRDQIKDIEDSYPNFEFQSHTYALHKKSAKYASYNTILNDANSQKKYYDFKFLAYPNGRKSKTMIKAYKASGIKMAFSFVDYGYATRKQNVYKIKRFAILGNSSIKKFRRICN